MQTAALEAQVSDKYLLTGWLVAFFLHGGLLLTGATLDNQRPQYRADYVPVDVVEVKPAEPVPPVVAQEPEAIPEPIAKKIAHVVDLTKTPPQETAPIPTESAPDAAADSKPVFGLGRKSFGKNGSFRVRTGNTVGIRPEDSALTDEIRALKPVPTYQVSKLPRITSQPTPVYPAALRGAGIEGDVILELLIDSEGKVVSATVVESSNDKFNQSALDAAYKLSFSPARQGKTAVAVKIRFPVKYRLT